MACQADAALVVWEVRKLAVALSSISFDNGEFLSVVAIKFDRKLETAMYHVDEN